MLLLWEINMALFEPFFEMALKNEINEDFRCGNLRFYIFVEIVRDGNLKLAWTEQAKVRLAFVQHQAAQNLRLKTGRLGRHYLAFIGYLKDYFSQRRPAHKNHGCVGLLQQRFVLL